MPISLLITDKDKLEEEEKDEEGEATTKPKQAGQYVPLSGVEHYDQAEQLGCFQDWLVFSRRNKVLLYPAKNKKETERVWH